MLDLLGGGGGGGVTPSGLLNSQQNVQNIANSK